MYPSFPNFWEDLLWGSAVRRGTTYLMHSVYCCTQKWMYSVSFILFGVMWHIWWHASVKQVKICIECRDKDVTLKYSMPTCIMISPSKPYLSPTCQRSTQYSLICVNVCVRVPCVIYCQWKCQLCGHYTTHCLRVSFARLHSAMATSYTICYKFVTDRIVLLFLKNQITKYASQSVALSCHSTGKVVTVVKLRCGALIQNRLCGTWAVTLAHYTS